jgi:hypothetical protein
MNFSRILLHGVNCTAALWISINETTMVFLVLVTHKSLSITLRLRMTMLKKTLKEAGRAYSKVLSSVYLEGN